MGEEFVDDLSVIYVQLNLHQHRSDVVWLILPNRCVQTGADWISRSSVDTTFLDSLDFLLVERGITSPFQIEKAAHLLQGKGSTLLPCLSNREG